jgi:hypothetical protein
MKITRILTVSIVIASMLLMTVAIPGVQAGANPGVLPPTAKVQGLTLGEWGTKLWQALFAIPLYQNPLLDHLWPTCYLERIGNVGIGVGYGSSGSGECEMPAGMMLFVPVVGTECSNAEIPPFYGSNEEELRACVLQFVPENMEASIDGISVRNIEQYAVLSPLYQFTVGKDNVLGAIPGTYISVAYQAGFLLAPLSPGEHVVHVLGEIPFFPFEYDWVYYITVTNRGLQK